MDATVRRRFENRLRDRLSEEDFTMALHWDGPGPEPDYAMVRIQRAGTAIGIAVSALAIHHARSQAGLIEALVRDVNRRYHSFERGEEA